MESLRHFREIWLTDFEYRADTGERPEPLCIVAHEYRTGRVVRQWLGDESPAESPIPGGPDSLIVAYLASAELGCYLALGWELPTRILDLYVEFRNQTNGMQLPHGRGLLGALTYRGLPSIAADMKDEMRALALRAGEHSESERAALLRYCESDVTALAMLLSAMLPTIDVPRALLRGRYMAAVAHMESNGVPIDVDTLGRLRTHWDSIKSGLIEAFDPQGEIYRPIGNLPDADTAAGASLFDVADEYEIERHTLAAVAGDLHEQEREAIREYRKAIAAARKATGITYRAACNWEDSGKDYSTWPGLDTTARTLAREYPALNIGPGFSMEAGYDDCDYAGKLWALLREPDAPATRKYGDDNLRRAAELVQSSGNHRWAGRRSFSAAGFGEYLKRHRIAWRRIESGALDLSDETFREGAKLHPETIGPLRELRHALSQLRLSELAVGTDGRNRCMLSPFASKTGRNQPSNARFIFGPSTWLRSLIMPEPGRALCYVDWSGQEYGIAAALSGDDAMKSDYLSGDPYLAFGKRIGAVPDTATKQTHGQIRDCLKVACGLGAMYGAGPHTVAAVLGVPRCQAAEWLSAHRVTYQRYWDWSEQALNLALLTGEMRTCFGWRLLVNRHTRGRSLRNFPMQSTGAEMMRLAACWATEQGIRVAAPVHDAFLIEADADEIDAETERMQTIMREASSLVLGGFELRTDAKIVRDGERYFDPRGAEFWGRVMALLEASEAAAEIDVSAQTIPE